MPKMVATKRLSYATRRLQAGDVFMASNRDARLLEAIGKARPDIPKPLPKVPPHNELTMLRAEYERVVGRRPFYGWDAAQLRARIAVAKAED